MQDLTQEQWRNQINENPEAIIVDVRTEEETEEGIISNAIHIDIRNAPAFMEKVESLDRTGSYYLYCRSGNRSGQACMIMDSLGFSETYNLLGGMLEWEGEIV